MKKLILSLLCLLILCGCGGESKDTPKEIVIENVESTSTLNNVYYYDQLTDLQKSYYDLFLEASKNSENVVKGDIKFDRDDYVLALRAFSYDYPNYYWWGKGVSTTYTSDGFKSKSDETKEAINSNMTSLTDKVNSILETCKNENNYITIKNIHDYIVKNVQYSKDEENCHNIVGSLLKGKSVCDGYATAFKYLCNEAGFNCNIIEGSALNSDNELESHAWNEVELNNKWYLVDTTWDKEIDPRTEKEVVSYHYFLVDEEMLNSDHEAIDTYKYHTCDDLSLFYANMPGEYYEIYDEDKISKSISTWLNQGYKDFYLKFKEYNDGLKAHTFLLENEEFLNIFKQYRSDFNIEIGGEYSINSRVLHIFYTDCEPE